MGVAASTRVLVVEDDPVDVLAVQRSLFAEGDDDGFDVRHAGTLAEGMEQLGREPVDVLLLDLGLPDCDGVETVVRFRRRAPDVPLVVFTGSDAPQLAATTLEAGADGHLVKGALGALDLRRSLRRAIRRRDALRRGHVPAREGTAPHEAGLVDDLRNLQALVLGNAEMLREDADGDPRVRRRADALLRAARIAVLLTERLFARGERDGRPTESVELSGFVQRAEPLLRTVIPAHVTLRLALSAGLPPAIVKAERLFCALLELVANAVDAIGGSRAAIELRTGAQPSGSSGSGRLRVVGRFEAGPHVWLEVCDTGRGFDAASLVGAVRSARGAGGADYGASHLEQMLADGEAGLSVDGRPGEGASFRILLPTRED